MLNRKNNMKRSDETNDLIEVGKGIVKSIASKVPILAEIIAGHDSYKKSAYERNLKKFLEHLQDKVDDISKLFNDEWLNTEEGKIFTRKVFDACLDVQIEEKQELFVNALVNGIRNKEIENIGKLKFIDILRQVSKLSLMVLSDMHAMFKGNSSATQIMPDSIAEKLSHKYEPYEVGAAIYELRSHGLFSNVTKWIKNIPEGNWRADSYISDNLIAYTEYTYKFVEFISKIDS